MQSAGEIPSAGDASGPGVEHRPDACSDADGASIDCAGTGQDGAAQAGVTVAPRFTDRGDGTVRDNLTGLIWLRDAGCAGGLGTSFDAALAVAGALASGECGLSDGSVAGDWRMPNIKEMLSLIDFGMTSPALPAASNGEAAGTMAPRHAERREAGEAGRKRGRFPNRHSRDSFGGGDVRPERGGGGRSSIGPESHGFKSIFGIRLES